MLALVDGDILVYTSAFAAQKTQYHVTYDGKRYTFANALPAGKPESWKTWAKDNDIDPSDCVVEPEVNLLPLDAAIRIASIRLDQISEAVGATSVEMYASGDNNFRDTVAVTKVYKGNRKQPKPHYYEQVFDYYLSRGLKVVDGMEADDMLSIRQVESQRSGSPSCICSIDKDLWQVPGRHYNWSQDEGKQRFTIDRHKGHLWFLRQLLTGDATDNVPGLPGWGEVKATKFLAGFDSTSGRWAGVKELYKANEDDTGNDWDTYLTEQGRLIWMLRERGQEWSIDMYNQEVNK